MPPSCRPQLATRLLQGPRQATDGDSRPHYFILFIDDDKNHLRVEDWQIAVEKGRYLSLRQCRETEYGLVRLVEQSHGLFAIVSLVDASVAQLHHAQSPHRSTASINACDTLASSINSICPKRTTRCCHRSLALWFTMPTMRPRGTSLR